MHKKLFIFLLLSCGALSSAFAQNDSISPYQLSITKGTVGTDGQGKYLEVPVTLKNTDKDTLFYANWTCSWQRFYKTDTDLLKPEGANCDSNYLRGYALAPGESSTVQLKLYYKDPKATADLTFRVGFNLLKIPKLMYHVTREERNAENYIWSNTLSQPAMPVNTDRYSKGLRISAGYLRDFEAEVAYIISPFSAKNPTGGAWNHLQKTAAAGLEYVKDGRYHAGGAKLSYEVWYGGVSAQLGADYLYAEAGQQLRVMPKLGLTLYGVITAYYGYNYNAMKNSALQPYEHVITLQVNVIDAFYKAKK